MSREFIHPKIFEILLLKSGKMGEQSIRNAVSNIRKKNPSLTLNAAAHVFAQRKSASVFRYLTQADRTSLQQIAPLINNSKLSNGAIQKKNLYVKKIPFSYARDLQDAAYSNAEIYPFIYVIENSLRNLIIQKFGDEENWWEKFVNKETRDDAERIKSREALHSWMDKRGSHSIYYIGLDQLAKIITKNYPRFKDKFKDQNMFNTWIKECNPIRNMIAHNIPLKKEDRINIQLKAKYICRQIESNDIK